MTARGAPARTVRRLEEALLDPHVRRSRTALGRLLADGFVEFGSSGRVFRKARLIAALRREVTPRRVIRDFTVRVLAPGVALATYGLVTGGPRGGARTRSLRSSIWTRTRGGWRMVFHQGTPARAEGRR